MKTQNSVSSKIDLTSKAKKKVVAKPPSARKTEPVERAAAAPEPKPVTKLAHETIRGKMVTVKSVKDLKGANYNPRYITEKQLAVLKKSIALYGDLSGVVFNVRSGVLISGHQRMKTVEGLPSKIIKAKAKDKHGTIALGHIEVESDAGTIKLPYREVDWDNKLQEMAANVAANAAGGEFDQAKLGAVLAKLETGQFEIEMTGLDKLSAGKAIGKHKKTDDTAGKTDKYSASDDEVAEFDTIDPKAMKFAHECPKCGFRFGEPEKVKKTAAALVQGTVKTVKANAKSKIKTTRPVAKTVVKKPSVKSVTTKKLVAKPVVKKAKR